jgi:hypothetical protein
MSKSKLLKQRLDQAKKAYEEAMIEEQKKVGALVMQQYEKGTIRDQNLVTLIAKLVGDDTASDVNNPIQ